MNWIFDPFWPIDWKKVTQPHLSDQKGHCIGENLERKMRIFFLGQPTIYHFARITAFQIHLRCFSHIMTFWRLKVFGADFLVGQFEKCFGLGFYRLWHQLIVWKAGRFFFANSGIMPLFLPRLLTWNFKKFLAAKKIIAALILGSESNIFRRCSWHFTSASTFSLSSGNPITSVSSLQQMKSSVILVKSCADYNVFSFPSQVGLF